ncbi:MAG: HEAT repeat domain-containing protein [Planctomycetota bacterium]
MSTPLIVAFVAVLLGSSAFAQAKKAGPDLDEAKKKLLMPDEGNVRAGANICLEANNAESAELLLKTLGASQPHMRDIAFEFLEKFANPYAIAVIENACMVHKDENVRAWCADLLGAYQGKARLEPLFRALQEPSAAIKASAARALARLKAKEGVSRVASLKSHADPVVRAYANIAWAMGDIKNNAKAFAGIIDKDAGVRTALLGALPDIAPDLVVEKSKARIADADWRVRLQAVQNLQTIKTKDSVASLVLLVADGRRAIANTAEAALIKLTGKKFHGDKAWKSWWEGEGEKFEFPADTAPAESPAATGETGVFFGLPIDSDHVAFLIDRGATMGNPAPSGKGTKMEEVLGELEQTLKSLPAGTKFNVLAYNNTTSAWNKKAQPLNEKTIKGGLDFLRSQSLAGRKNIWSALLAAIEDSDIDTIYLMSDGEPEDGVYVHYNRVVDHLKRLNILRKVVIHTVHVSDPAWSAATAEWYRSQLREIAKGTGGKYVEK